MDEHQQFEDRFRGCLTGLAVCDALGTTLEFEPPGSFAPITDMVGGGPFYLPAGCWTDDTSMALCLARSLVRCNGFDPQDQVRRYIRWQEHGYMSSLERCFDIGRTVSSALYRFRQSGDPFSGGTGERSAGNGSIMRLAPVPMFHVLTPAKGMLLSGDSSRTTHGLKVCVDACRYLGGLLIGAMRGEDKDTLLSPGYSPVPGFFDRHPLHPNMHDVAHGSFKVKMPPEIRGTGYVVRSLEAALWAFFRTDSFRDGALAAVNLGDDADTTGAVYGQIAGAYYGETAMPKEWLDRLAKRDLINDIVDELAAAALSRD